MERRLTGMIQMSSQITGRSGVLGQSRKERSQNLSDQKLPGETMEEKSRQKAEIEVRRLAAKKPWVEAAEVEIFFI